MLLSFSIVSLNASAPVRIFLASSMTLSSIFFFINSTFAFSSSYYSPLYLTNTFCDLSNDSFLQLIVFHIVLSSSRELTLNLAIGFPALSEINGAYKFFIVLFCAFAIELYESSIFFKGRIRELPSDSPSEASILERTSILSKYNLSLPMFSLNRLATSSKWPEKGTLNNPSDTFLNSASNSFCSSEFMGPSIYRLSYNYYCELQIVAFAFQLFARILPAMS